MSVHGMGPPPLLEGKRYSFRRGSTEDGRATIEIPFGMRHASDDYGAVLEAEQATYMRQLASSLGLQVSVGYPGQFVFATVDNRDLAWLAIEEALLR